MGDYARALAAGSDLSATDRSAIAEKLHQYTGLSVEYILRADLRIDGGEFRQTLQGDAGLATGRLDTRFSGPDLDPLAQRADYDPQSTCAEFGLRIRVQRIRAQGSALRRGQDLQTAALRTFGTWNFQHQQPGQQQAGTSRQGSNVMPDLANAMKINPNLKVQLNARLFRSRHTVLPGRLRDASPAHAGKPASEYRIQVLRLGPHGLCQRFIAQVAARQRRRVHSSNQQ